MRLALITDVHGNREALEAVLEHAARAGTERYAFLGDFVGYCADPGWVVDCVREHVEHGAIAVRGNHDAGVAGTPASTMVPVARQVVEWTRAHLTDAQLEFLEHLPLQRIEEDMLFVHANAFAPGRWDYVLGRAEAERSLRATDRGYTFCGHVHEPRLFHVAGGGHVADFVPTAGVAVPVPRHRRWLVLPGSAGQPRDGNPAACYALLDVHKLTLTFHRVPYDHDAAAAKIRAAGLPEVLAQRLCDGQ
jgi:diadenosine tetraphosphatase ApaH/serine/threonine PP2A family protein phosphatase